MDATLIEVLSALARKWNFHKRRLDRAEHQTARFSLSNRANSLELRIQNESSPIPKLMLKHELISVDEAWAEVWNAEAYHKDVLDAAVEWCAAHTGFGGRLIFDLAVAGFEASALNPEMQPEAQKLSPALLSLPADTWRTTGWAKLVLSAQPKSEPSVPDSNADGGTSSTPTPTAETTEAATSGNSDDLASESNFVFQPNGDGYNITYHESGHVSAHGCKGLHQIHRLVGTPMVPVLMTELEGRSCNDPHSRQEMADQTTLKDVAAKLREAKSELERATASRDFDTIEVEHCRQEVEKWEDEVGKLLGIRGQVRDLNNPYDKKRPKIWGTINTAKKRLRTSGFSELADHLDGSIDSERAWFVYVPRLNPIPNWKTEKKDDSLPA